VIQPKAWLPRHRDLKTGFTYLDDVTDTYIGLVEPRRNEVLAKTTCLQSLGALWKFFLPRGVVFLRVLQDDLFCATVQVGRTVFVIGDSLFRYKCGSGTDGLRNTGHDVAFAEPGDFPDSHFSQNCLLYHFSRSCGHGRISPSIHSDNLVGPTLLPLSLTGCSREAMLAAPVAAERFGNCVFSRAVQIVINGPMWNSRTAEV